MRISFAHFGLALLLGCAISSCASMKDVIKAKDEEKGVTQTYAASAHQAYALSKKILRDSGADAIEDHEQEGYMLGSIKANEKSYGTLIGVWVEKADKENVNVTVVAKRKIRVQLLTQLTEEGFHKSFAKELAALPRPEPVVEAPKEPKSETKSSPESDSKKPAAEANPAPAAPKKSKKKK